MCYSATCVWLAILTFIIIDSTSGFYSPSDNIVKLTESNFDRQVLQDKAIWIVQFYAPWCKYCKVFAPEYKKLARTQKRNVKVGVIDVDAAKNLKKRYDVKYLPTIKIFFKKRNPTDYIGRRTASAIAKAIPELRKRYKNKSENYSNRRVNKSKKDRLK